MISKYYASLILLLGSVISTYAQPFNLSESDRQEIKQRAELQLQDFESLLNYISDQSRTRSATQRHIVSSYSNQDSIRNQIFYDGDVLIEDDVRPNPGDVETSFKPVSRYLNDFALFYQKQARPTVTFTDLQLSDVQQDSQVYVVARYRSTFEGQHTQYPDQPYVPQSRSATFWAAYDEAAGRWEVRIVGINYTRPGSDPLSATERTNTPTAPRSSDAPRADKGTEPTSPIKKKRAEAPPPAAQRDAPPLKFTDLLPPRIDRGDSMTLSWNNPVEGARLSLYQNNQKVRDLQQEWQGERWNWQVDQKPGSGYSIMLYEPTTDRQVRSNSFRVKSRFPMALKIGLPAAAVIGGYLLYANQNDVFPFSSDTPPPPAPSEPSPRIDIEPRVPTGGN